MENIFGDVWFFFYIILKKNKKRVRLGGKWRHRVLVEKKIGAGWQLGGVDGFVENNRKQGERGFQLIK